MIPETPNNIVETNTSGKSFKFRFEANRHLFEAFSKNLYSNPHDSVVREVISNAIDSQVRAKNEKQPLSIILNSEFIVQDHGIGISPDKMENCVGVYGVSDKRETNDEIGMYGFGFKSPFAISDQFVVETIPGDGFKYVWVIYKDLTGSGEISLTSQIETSEPSGTKVRVPIKPVDYQSMKMAVLKYINFLKPWPVTHFTNNFIANQPSILIEAEDYVACEEHNHYKILYDGWMPYHIDNTKIPKDVLIKIEKGHLRLSASRENITKTPELMSLIDKKLEKYWENLIVHIKENVAKLSCPLTIIQTLDNVIGRYKESFGKPINIEIKQHPIYGDFKWPDSFECEHVYKISPYNGKLSTYHNISDYDKLALIYIHTKDIKKLDSPYYKMKIKHILRYKSQYKELALITEKTQQNYSPIFKHLFDNAIDIVKYKIPRTTSNTTPKKYEKGTISASIFDTKSNKYINTRVKFKDGNYIYGFRNAEIDILPKDSSLQYCVVSKRVTKKIKELPNWKDTREYIEEKAKNFTEEHIKLFEIHRTINSSKTYIKNLFKRNIIDVKNVDANKLNNINPDDLKLMLLASDYGFIQTKEDDDIINDIYDKYPLLSYMWEYKLQNKEALKHLEEYITMVQEKNKCKSA